MVILYNKVSFFSRKKRKYFGQTQTDIPRLYYMELYYIELTKYLLREYKKNCQYKNDKVP